MSNSKETSLDPSNWRPPSRSPHFESPSSYNSLLRSSLSTGTQTFPQTQPTNLEQGPVPFPNNPSNNAWNSNVGINSATGNGMTLGLNLNGHPQQSFPHFSVGYNNQYPILNPYSSNVLNSLPNNCVNPQMNPNLQMNPNPNQFTQQLQMPQNLQQQFNPNQQMYQSQPMQVMPNNNVFQISCQIPLNPSLLDLSSVPESVLKWQRIFNIICYFILFVCATIVLVAYIVVYRKYIPPLNLSEIGNSWMFEIIYISCGFTIVTTAFALLTVICAKGQLSPRLVGFIDFAVMLGWFPVFFVGIGVSESSRKGKHGPSIQTSYGKYVASVCGNSGSNLKLDDAGFAHTVSPLFDSDKCDAISRLNTAVFSIYIWVAVALIFSILGYTFGLGSWNIKQSRQRNRALVSC